jgi:hypothetical protein
MYLPSFNVAPFVSLQDFHSASSVIMKAAALLALPALALAQDPAQGWLGYAMATSPTGACGAATERLHVSVDWTESDGSALTSAREAFM